MPEAPQLHSRGYKYPIYPTPEQEDLLNRTAGCCRHLYNLALEEAKLEYQQYLAQKELGVLHPTPPSTTGYDFCNKLVRFKSDPEKSWLSEVSNVALQQTLLHLGAAYSRFFKQRKGYPRFKSRHTTQSFTLMSNAFRLKGKQLYIAKSKEPVSIDWTRSLPSPPSSVTLIKEPTGQWYASFRTAREGIKTHGTKILGIDLGLKDYAVLSTGEKIANPKHFAKWQRILKRRQQALSRKHKGSKNRTKAGHRVAIVHGLIKHARNDHLHQLSRKLVNDCAVIGLESLRPSNMVKNRHLSKAVSDASWATFRQYVCYKAQESDHCTVVLMDVFFPSTHLCSACKQRLDRKLTLSERGWTCPHCGTHHDRDENAALNLRDEAYAVYSSHTPRPRGQVLRSNTRYLT